MIPFFILHIIKLYTSPSCSVIKSKINIGGKEIEAEITLTDRDTMQFRMLLGRTALMDNFLVDSGLSYLSGPRPKNIYELRKGKGKK